jgi:putative transposase
MGIDRQTRYVTVILDSVQGLKGKEVRNLRIVKQLGEFFAVFTVKAAIPDQKIILRAIALDPNHKNLAYGVGTDQKAIEIAAPSWLKKADRRLDELRARRDRCKRKSRKVYTDAQAKKGYYWKPSRRWAKFDRMLEEMYRKRRDQTKTFLFTVAQKLCRQYDLISIGDYTPDGSGSTSTMRRAMSNQSLIGRLKEVLAWVALKSGKYFHEFSERGTTRTCHCCDHVVDGGIPPELRSWYCPNCLSFHIRDENAAQNGLRMYTHRGFKPG